MYFGELVFESDEKNLVLEELRVRRFAVIQEVRKRYVEERFEGEKCLSQS